MTELLHETDTLVDPILEYRKLNTSFAQGWQAYAHALIEQIEAELSQPGLDNKLVVTKNRAIHSQLRSMEQTIRFTCSPVESVMYFMLRATKLQVPVTPETAGAEPRKLTDQRLLIEIFLLTKNDAGARALLEQYPSLRAA